MSVECSVSADAASGAHSPRTAIIIGPTAGGKTALAVESALLFTQETGRPAEVISADSMLIYRGLNIGSAKPSAAEMRGVPHHLIDLCEPTESFSVQQWLSLAEARIAEIRSRGGWAIVVGGTHLYVKALLDGLFEGPGADAALRERLNTLPPSELRSRLERIDPAAAAKLHPNDIRRTIRALEVYELTGKPMSEHQTQWDSDRPAHADDRTLIGLDWPVEMINPRINERVREMVRRGLVEEVRGLHTAGQLGMQAGEALGYKQLVEHFKGRCTLDEAIEEIKIETRRFAKNQRTWARRLRTTKGSIWIDAAAIPAEEWPRLVIDKCL